MLAFFVVDAVISCRISQFVRDPSESSHLIQLLLPFVLNPSEKYKVWESLVHIFVCSCNSVVVVVRVEV